MKGQSNKVLLIVFGIVILIMGISLINSNRARTYSNTSVTVVSEAADGLDLEALLELVKEARSAEDLEKALNEPDGINNLDLNEDGEVDFISVTEYGNEEDAFGFSLTVDPVEGETQEIASVEIVENGDRADIEVRGNEQIYGPRTYYYGYHPIGSYLLWSYLIGPHRYYASPWRYGYYPSYYRTYSPVRRSIYSDRVSDMTRGSNATKRSSSQLASKSGLKNPNQGKAAGRGITQRLRNPTSTQRSFQARNPSKASRRGGFGSSSSVRRPSRSRSSGGFGK